MEESETREETFEIEHFDTYSNTTRLKAILYNMQGHWLQYIVVVCLLFGGGLLAGRAFEQHKQEKELLMEQEAELAALQDRGYFPLAEVMQQAGYTQLGETAYETTVKDMQVRVFFDYESDRCYKNAYEIPLNHEYEMFLDTRYLSGEVLKCLIGSEVSYDSEKQIVLTPVDFTQESFPEKSMLIAHAGGAVRETMRNGTYTNSLEALVQNYNLGHRVFEFDFCQTTDNRLACIHDWKKYGNGHAVSEEEWLATKVGGLYTSLTLETLMDQMLVIPDIYVVTDTKSYELTPEEISYQFQMLYDTAMERDPEMLDHFIPQIYSDEMYDILMEIYPWKSLIYTAYATKNTGEQIASFAQAHDNIQVITCPAGDKRFTDAVKEQIHTSGKKLYIHTVNSYSKLADYLTAGVDGFYSDYLLPYDEEVIRSYELDDLSDS